MPAITLDAIEAKQTELSKLIAQFKDQANQPTLRVLQEVEIELHSGEHYAGPVLDADGNLMHHLVLRAELPTGEITWQAAMDWADSIGGALPTRQEQALLFANCKPMSGLSGTGPAKPTKTTPPSPGFATSSPAARTTTSRATKVVLLPSAGFTFPLNPSILLT